MSDGLNSEVSFGPARRGDIEFLVSAAAGSPQPWTARAFSEELEHDPPTLFVLQLQGRAVAFVAVRIQGPEMDIVNLAVTPARRRRGLGRKLLLAMLEYASQVGIRRAFLEVRESNLEARGLYASAGFLESQRRRGFYRDPPEDALLLSLDMSRLAG